VSADLERDLGAWSRGELTRARLLEAHGAPAAGCVALHERLVGVAASTRIPDPEAGWAALLEKIDAPAPVVPPRRHVQRRRTVSLLVAAAVVVGGSALAAIWTGSDRGSVPSPTAPGALVGPPAGSPLPGSNDRRLVLPPSRSTNEPAGKEPGGSGPSDGGAKEPRHQGNTSGGGGTPSPDDPRDRDRGTGNDGSHDDHGSGNDGRSGTLPHGSHGGGH
jgi:hypothetical protein